jgi:hypothetical protein
MGGGAGGGVIFVAVRVLGRDETDLWCLPFGGGGGGGTSIITTCTGLGASVRGEPLNMLEK